MRYWIAPFLSKPKISCFIKILIPYHNDTICVQCISQSAPGVIIYGVVKIDPDNFGAEFSIERPDIHFNLSHTVRVSRFISIVK